MRRLALTIALACVLSGVARAGDMHSTGAVAQPTPGTVMAAGETQFPGATAPGEMPSTGATALTIILTLIGIVP